MLYPYYVMLWGGFGCMQTSLLDLVYPTLTEVKGSMYMMTRMVFVCRLYPLDGPSDLRIYREGLT